MDSQQRDIEVVEDDMGEGYKDPIEEKENLLDKLQRENWKIEERLMRKRKCQNILAWLAVICGCGSFGIW